MSKKTKKKKILWQQYIVIAFSLLIGAICGLLFVSYMNRTFDADKSTLEEIPYLIILFFSMYAAILAHTIIHEAGHLIFGLISGYKFSSFRIMSFMWVRESGKVKFRRLSLAGTGGQCLMVPPNFVDGKFPVVLYNLGGSLMNVIAGLVFLGLHFISVNPPFFSFAMLIFAVVGFMVAIINGIPIRTGMVNNDGHNAFSLTRSPDALRAFWVQLKVSEQTSKNVRIKDMPDEWFSVPSDEEMKNSIIAVMGVFSCNRLMDELRFEDADALMAHLLEIDSGIIGLHRSLMTCDRIFIELINENRSEILNKMMTMEQKKFMKSMKKFPSVLRTEYAYALLFKKDAVKAEKVKKQFEKCAKSYPYPNEIQSERELMEIAYQKAGRL